MVEHPAAVRQVLGSTPSVPLYMFIMHLFEQPWNGFVFKIQ